MTTPHDDFETRLTEDLRALGATLDADTAVLDEAAERAETLTARRRRGTALLVAASVVGALGLGLGVLVPLFDDPAIDPIGPVEDADGVQREQAEEARRLAEEALEERRRAEEQARLRAEGATPMPMPEVGLCEDTLCTNLGVGSWRSIPAGPIAAPRVAVWTGDQLLVGGWCGEVGCAPVASLAAFDPATSAWTELAAPPDEWRGEQRHTVWTGTELVVIGGRSTSEDVDGVLVPTVSGHAYDPTTDTWREVPEAPLAPRDGHSVTWTGTEVIVFGGFDVDRSLQAEEPPVTMFADGAAWDPATGEWRAIADGPLEARAQHAAHWTGQELLIAAGGTTQGFFPEFSWPGTPTTAAAYDPIADRWSDVTDVGVGGDLAASAWTGSELVLWTGATPDWPAYGPDGPVEGAGAVWSPATGTVETLEAPPVQIRREGSAPSVWAPELDAMLTWGGGCGEGCNQNHGDGARWQSDQGWTPLADAPIGPRRNAVAAWTGIEMIVLGGYQFDQFDDSVESGLMADGARWRP